MILIDANLLLYAYNPDAEEHEPARQWVESVLSGPSPVRFAWITLLAFLRIATSPRVFTQPLTPEEATAVVASWLEQPSAAVLDAGPQHWTILAGLLVEGQAKGPLVMDAHLAALAIEHGATLCTTDRDFTRFDGLRHVNPLVTR